MSVSTTQTLVQYVGNGSTVTPYPTGFPFAEDGWVRVSVMGPDGIVTDLNIGTDYIVSGAGDPAGGEVVTLAAYDSDYLVTIYRVVPVTQLLDLQYNDRLPAEELEGALDKLTYIAQQLAGNTADPGRAIKFPVSEPASFNTNLPAPVLRRDTVLFFDPITGEMQILRLDQLAQRLLVILGAEAVLPYRTREISESITITQEDVNSSIRVNTASDVTITLPETFNFASEFFCSFSRFNSGAVEFTAPPGVVIESEVGAAPRIFGAKKPVGVQLIGVNRWWVYGDIY